MVSDVDSGDTGPLRLPENAGRDGCLSRLAVTQLTERALTPAIGQWRSRSAACVISTSYYRGELETSKDHGRHRTIHPRGVAQLTLLISPPAIRSAVRSYTARMIAVLPFARTDPHKRQAA